MADFSELYAYIAVLFLIFMRMLGLFIVAPILSSRNIPQPVKIILPLLFAYILMPIIAPVMPVLPASLLEFIPLIVKELLVGIIFGFTLQTIFWAIQMTGFLLDTQIGFGVVNIIDPMLGAQVPLVGNFLQIIALLIFLAINGHHVMIAGLVASFDAVPLTHVNFHNQLAEVAVQMIINMFIIALKISLPVLVALLLMDVVLGILARFMPQLNIFVVGIPAKLFVGIFMLFILLPFYASFLEKIFTNIYRLLTDAMANMV